MRRFSICFIWALTALILNGQDQGDHRDGADFIPLAYGSYMSFDDQALRGIGGGLIISSGEQDEWNPELRDSLMTAALFTRHDLRKEFHKDSPRGFNNIDFLLQKKRRRHQFFTLLKSYSDKPVYGGSNTFNLDCGYGYELVNRAHHSLWLGASLCVSDCGVSLPGSVELTLMPLSFLHYDFRSSLMLFSFDFTTSPMADLVLNPEGKLRANASAILTDMQALDDHGIKYDLSLEYRLFKPDHPLGDLAGIKLGYQCEDYEYDTAGGESLQISWNSVYTTMDLSFLELTGGWIIDGRQSSSEGLESEGSEGFVIRAQLAWCF